VTDDNVVSAAEERRRLVGRVDVEFHQVLRNVEACRIRDIERPFIGEWSLKDIVGHLASWEAEVVSSLRELREGRRPKILDFDQGMLDGWNNDHVERKRDLNFFNVMEQFRGGHSRLAEEIEFVSDEDLVTEHSVHNNLVLSVIDHEREHWHEIAARLAGMEGARHTGPQSVPEEAATG
jgi:hypothetical protein